MDILSDGVIRFTSILKNRFKNSDIKPQIVVEWAKEFANIEVSNLISKGVKPFVFTANFPVFFSNYITEKDYVELDLSSEASELLINKKYVIMNHIRPLFIDKSIVDNRPSLKDVCNNIKYILVNSQSLTKLFEFDDIARFCILSSKKDIFLMNGKLNDNIFAFLYNNPEKIEEVAKLSSTQACMFSSGNSYALLTQNSLMKTIDNAKLNSSALYMVIENINHRPSTTAINTNMLKNIISMVGEERLSSNISSQRML